MAAPTTIVTGIVIRSVALATYTITAPMAATPTATQTITIAEATAGATVHYTTDGTDPTTASRVYTGPLTIASPLVFKFIAVAPGYAQSAVRMVAISVQ